MSVIMATAEQAEVWWATSDPGDSTGASAVMKLMNHVESRVFGHGHDVTIQSVVVSYHDHEDPTATMVVSVLREAQ